VKVTPKGKPRVKVLCSWHGVKSPKTFPNLTVADADYTIIENYSGWVVADLS